MLLFRLLDDRTASSTSVCLFLVEENSSQLLKQQLPKLEDFVIPDMMSRPIQKPRPFSALTCTVRSSSLGVAKAGTLKLDLRPIFFLRIPFYTL